MEQNICPFCGQAHQAGARFCPVTGKALPAAQTCPSCGGKVLAGWNVCPRCGNALGVRSQTQPVQPARKGRAWFVAAIMVLVLLIAGGYFVFGYLGFFTSGTQDAQITSTGNIAQANDLSISGQLPSSTDKPTAIAAQVVPIPVATNPPASSTPLPTLDTEVVSTYVPPTIEAQFTEIPTFTPTIQIYTAAALTVSASLTEGALFTPESTSTSSSSRGKIVFTCQVFQDPDRNQICLIQADGTGWQRLSRDDMADYMYPSFSPDGESIVFSLEKIDQQIYEMDLSGNQRQLTNLPFKAYAPAISPDNRWIVFVGNDGLQQLLWLMERDGSNPICLTPTINGDAFDPVWSPDGKQILFAATISGNTQLYVINAEGSDPRKLTQLSNLRGRSDWAPNGETIATYQGLSWQREIVLLDQDGKLLNQITQGGNNLAPSFSPDGQWLAFTSYRDNYRNNNGCEIYIMRADGSQITRLTENNYCDWQPNWGP
jgi:TolB protein